MKTDRTKLTVMRVLRAIEAAHATFPEQRVGQIIANACGCDPYYVENATLASLLERYAASSKEVKP